MVTMHRNSLSINAYIYRQGEAAARRQGRLNSGIETNVAVTAIAAAGVIAGPRLLRGLLIERPLTPEFACIPPAPTASIAPDAGVGLWGEQREVLCSLCSKELWRGALPGRRALLIELSTAACVCKQPCLSDCEILEDDAGGLAW